LNGSIVVIAGQFDVPLMDSTNRRTGHPLESSPRNTPGHRQSSVMDTRKGPETLYPLAAGAGKAPGKPEGDRDGENGNCCSFVWLHFHMWPFPFPIFPGSI